MPTASHSQRIVLLPGSRQKLMAGADRLAESIRPTLGPNARTVVVEAVRDLSPVEILDDGGTIARRMVSLGDRDENVGAMLLRESLWQMHETVGDGAATAAVIFQGIVRASRRLLAAGFHAAHLRPQLERAARTAASVLRAQARPLSGQEEIARCALAICHDEKMADLLGEILYITGGEGYVNVLESRRRGLEREYFDGSYWTGSWISATMITDIAKREAIHDDPAIFISDLDLREADEILPLMEATLAAGRKSLFMLVEQVSGAALAALLSNHQSGVLPCLAVSAGAIYSELPYLHEDLAHLTGARPFLKAAGESPTAVTAADLGHARRAWATRSDFGVVAGSGDPHALRRHIRTLRVRLRAAETEENANLLRKRLAKLLGGAATLHVGAATDVEKESRLGMAKRTVRALHAAMRDGVVPGGGSGLARCAQRLRGACQRADETMGTAVMADALEEPLRVIAASAGLEPAPILGKVLTAPEGSGFDARAAAIVDMRQAGIVDPVAVLEAAIITAAHAAALLLTTEVLVHSPGLEKDEWSRKRPRLPGNAPQVAT
ncbi:MAG: chaperonin GroEL [Caldilineaceae bacterium]|nr:chaperonin GroEL [Caldilineaceae bacterium]